MDAVVTYSKINATILPSEIQGEEGSIVIDKISDPEKVEIYYRDGRIEDISLPQNEQTMYYEIKEFIDVIRNGQKQSSVNSHSKSLTVMGIMDEARKQMGLEYPADTITENH
jgi:predicted dehydrogenase